MFSDFETKRLLCLILFNDKEREGDERGRKIGLFCRDTMWECACLCVCVQLCVSLAYRHIEDPHTSWGCAFESPWGNTPYLFLANVVHRYIDPVDTSPKNGQLEYMTRACACACMNTCMCACVCMCTNMRMCLCMSIGICICVCN